MTVSGIATTIFGNARRIYEAQELSPKYDSNQDQEKSELDIFSSGATFLILVVILLFIISKVLK